MSENFNWRKLPDILFVLAIIIFFFYNFCNGIGAFLGIFAGGVAGLAYVYNK